MTNKRTLIFANKQVHLFFCLFDSMLWPFVLALYLQFPFAAFDIKLQNNDNAYIYSVWLGFDFVIMIAFGFEAGLCLLDPFVFSEVTKRYSASLFTLVCIYNFCIALKLLWHFRIIKLSPPLSASFKNKQQMSQNRCFHDVSHDQILMHIRTIDTIEVSSFARSPVF